MTTSQSKLEFHLRPAQTNDLEQIIKLDKQVSGIEKDDYWRERFTELHAGLGGHIFIAEKPNGLSPIIIGFIVGEVRAWEFGSRPCGWIFALAVDPEFRVRGIGEQLFTQICGAFKRNGATSVRTMVARKDQLNMSFFRAQGMMGGPFIELEKSI